MTFHRPVYAATARFDGTARALTEDEMRGIAPSIFATNAHESRSARFAPIPTIEVLRALQAEGFSPVGVKQGGSRIEGKADFTKHLIRLRRLDDGAAHQVGDNVLEILLKNANDGTASYDLMAGIFRVRCQNSLVAQTATIDSVKIPHLGADVAGRVIEGTFRVLDEAKALLEAPREWSAINLNGEAKMALAEAAHVIRFANHEGNTKTPIKPAQLLEARRAGDNGGDLWTVANVVQENCIRGGMTATTPAHRDGEGNFHRRRKTTTRGISGIDDDIRINKALWLISERLAGILKHAA